MNNTYANPMSQSASQAPASSALDGIRRRVAYIAQNVQDVHGIADRACGQTAGGEKAPAPRALPNGMLDEIEEALDSLVSSSDSAVARLSRIA
jgi:hypothetical protein